MKQLKSTDVKPSNTFSPTVDGNKLIPCLVSKCTFSVPKGRGREKHKDFRNPDKSAQSCHVFDVDKCVSKGSRFLFATCCLSVCNRCQPSAGGALWR